MRTELNIVLANPRGFCAGVVRAVEIVERALANYGPPVYVYHEIVHNRHVIETLKAKGAVFVERTDEVPEGAPTVFSAHGVSLQVEGEARARGLTTIDATCPLVHKVHNQGRRYAALGRSIVYIGEKGHQEVKGTIGQIPASVHVVETVADVMALSIPTDAPVAYITQTTLSVDDTRAIIDALTQRFEDILGPNTSDICYAAQNRQSAVRELARAVDLILVVGGRNSHNSNRLVEVAKQSGLPAYLISDQHEIDWAWLNNVETVGVTAGASAPERLVQNVIEALSRFAAVNVTEMAGVTETAFFRLPSI
jgi:4-hydroxy-3-methylbut-2-en-1-yl diphosphate reductase